MSLPPRGAWIEISKKRQIMSIVRSLPPRGAWIEIPIKCAIARPLPSLPPRGAWIEIIKPCESVGALASLPPRGAWIEMPRHVLQAKIRNGRSPRGERGLKLTLYYPINSSLAVAPPAGSVD